MISSTQKLSPCLVDPTQSLPRKLLVSALILCLLPLAVGQTSFVGDLANLKNIQLDAIQGLLEWTAAIACFFVASFAFVGSRKFEDTGMLILALSFLVLGIMDAFQSFSVFKLMSTHFDMFELMYFSWTFSQVFTGIIFILCATLGLWFQSKKVIFSPLLTLLFLTAFCTISYWSLQFILEAKALPQTFFPNDLIKHPYDVGAGILFLLASPLFLKCHKKSPNYFVAAVAISLVPQISASTYIALGSKEAFDYYFIVAHAMKVLGSIIPVIGLVLEYRHRTALAQWGFSENEARLQAVVNETVDGIITITRLGIIETFNKACEKIFGYKAEEVIGQNVKMLMPDPYHSEHDKYLSNYHYSGERKIIGIGREVEGKRKDGTTFPIDLSVSEVQLRDKKLYCGIVRDITERKDNQVHRARMLAQLDEGQARLQAVVDETVDGIITINNKGTVETFNKACEKIFGYEAGTVIGQNVKMLMPDPYHSEHDKYLANYHDTGDKKIIGIGREVEGQRKDGTIFPMELSVSEVNIKGKKLYSGIVRDISERKEAQAKLAKTLEDLQLSNEELEKFAYVASHDLKSPLRAIDNLSKWLEEDLQEVIDDKSRERMQKLRGRVSRMERLLDDLLEYSRAGRKLEDLGCTTVSNLVEEVKGLLNIPPHISVEVDRGLENISIPRMPLEQVFNNLISNAIKHNNKPRGTIFVSGRDMGNYFEFSIKDDGPGIPEKFHKKVFEMFQTLKPRDEIEGSGMGLALVKKIICSFGGRIDLESKENEGAKFTFTWAKKPVVISSSQPLNDKTYANN